MPVDVQVVTIDAPLGLRDSAAIREAASPKPGEDILLRPPSLGDFFDINR